MKLKLPWSKSKKMDLMTMLEAKLEAAMQPVQARADYLQGLRNELVGGPQKRFLGLRVKSPEFMLAIAGGALSVIVLLAAGVRAVITLLGAMGILQQVNKQIKENPPNPLTPTS